MMNTSYPYDPELHPAGSVAAQGLCSHHARDGSRTDPCTGDAVVSFVDSNGEWQSGCSLALEELVERGDIEPLGQGA
jgi:hypothetical protein